MGQGPITRFGCVPQARVRQGDDKALNAIETSYWLDIEDGMDVADANRFFKLTFVLQPELAKSLVLEYDCELYLHVGGGRRVLCFWESLLIVLQKSV